MAVVGASRAFINVGTTVPAATIPAVAVTVKAPSSVGARGVGIAVVCAISTFVIIGTGKTVTRVSPVTTTTVAA